MPLLLIKKEDLLAATSHFTDGEPTARAERERERARESEGGLDTVTFKFRTEIKCQWSVSEQDNWLSGLF